MTTGGVSGSSAGGFKIAKALAAPAIRTRLSEIDVAGIGSTSSALEKTLRADLTVNRELVKSIGLKLD